MSKTFSVRGRALARHVPSVCVASLTAVVVLANTAAAAVPSHLRRYDVAIVRTDHKADRADRAYRDGKLHLPVRGLGRSFDLVLEPSPSRSPHAESIVVDGNGVHRSHPAAEIWRGRLADDADASVSVVISGSSIVGSVRSRGKSWYLEPMRRYDPAALPGSTLIYSADDLEQSALPPGACGAEDGGDGHESAGGQAGDGATAPLLSDRVASAAAVSSLLELSLVADHDFYADHGADSEAYMLAILDRVSLLSESDLGMMMSAVQTVVYQAAGLEPLTSSTSSGALLGSLAEARAAWPALIGAGDVTQLFTGRDLDQNVIGIAYVSQVCSRNYAASVAQDFSSNLHLMTLLVGHELGHTLGAWHDGQSGSPCSGAAGGYVMWPSISSGLAEHFSACSISSIEPVLADASCLSPAIAPDCGNGHLDSGEQCDDGNNDNGDCCRMDCGLDAAGSFCEGDGNDCTQDVCSGNGSCLHPPVLVGNCDDADACTTDGLCAASICLASQEWTPLLGARVKAGFAAGLQDDALQLRALVGASLQSPPSEGGAVVRFLDEAGGLLRESVVPAALWSAVSEKSFRYDAAAEGTAPSGGISSMQVRFKPGSATAKVKLKFAAADLAFLQGRSQVGVQVLIGDTASGDCGTALALACRGGNSSVSCE